MGHRVLPADIDLQITEQFGSRENFLQQELDRLGLPDSVTVQQGWRSFQQTWFFDAVYQLSDGRWVESSWYRYSDGTWSHMGWDWLSGPPDLAGYAAYYP